MFKIHQSPIYKVTQSPVMIGALRNKQDFQRYTSADQNYSRLAFSANSSRIDPLKENKKCQISQKTERTNKRRVHSHKKLTLAFEYTAKNSFSTSQTGTLSKNQINIKESENFKKNLQLKSVNSSKTTGLQKKGRLPGIKCIQPLKFSSSKSRIRVQNAGSVPEKQDDKLNRCYFLQEKHISREDKNQYFSASNPENDYQREIQKNHQNLASQNVSTQGAITEGQEYSQISTSVNTKQLVYFCQQTINKIKSTVRASLLESQLKIKELQSLLLHNRQKLQEKDRKIRELQLAYILKSQNTETRNISKGSLPNGIEVIAGSHSKDYLLSRVFDLEKKVSVLMKWDKERHERIDSKIEEISKFLNGFIAVKMHNFNFYLKTFVAKSQTKIQSILHKIVGLRNHAFQNSLQAYENISDKCQSFVAVIKNFAEIGLFQTHKETQASKLTVIPSATKSPEKCYFENIKTTFNTTSDFLKHYQHRSPDHQTDTAQTSFNQSFWHNLEDILTSNTKGQQEQSFTDDSFSYGPKMGLLNFNHNKISTNSFILGSYPSFSKYSQTLNSAKDSLSSSIESLSYCTKVIEEIFRSREGPISCFMDEKGNLRYKSSSSYIFDRKGNILQPSKNQIDFCQRQRWILIE